MQFHADIEKQTAAKKKKKYELLQTNYSNFDEGNEYMNRDRNEKHITTPQWHLICSYETI